MNDCKKELTDLKEKIESSLLFKELRSWTDSQVDEYLDYRESEAFEQKWLMAYEEINENQSNMELPSQLIDQIREIVFKKIYSITNSSDLAAYCSDDFELISKNLCFRNQIDYLTALLNSYESGVLPK